MKRYALIDPYVPASAATLEEALAAAGRAGLDGFVYVADTPDELPDPEELEALTGGGRGPAVHPACIAMGPGYRFVVLLPEWSSAATYDALDALGDALSIQQAVTTSGGCALPASPRQSPDGEVMRETPRLAPEPAVGTVALVAGGSRLGRDLDMEDAGAAGRRVLAGTGPFGTSEDIGRYATLLPVDARDAGALVAAFNKGLGVAVELIARSEGDARPPRKKRRRRRRKGGGEGGDG